MLSIRRLRLFSLAIIVAGGISLSQPYTAAASEYNGPACGTSCSAGPGTGACSATAGVTPSAGCSRVCCDAPDPAHIRCYCDD